MSFQQCQRFDITEALATVVPLAPFLVKPQVLDDFAKNLAGLHDFKLSLQEIRIINGKNLAAGFGSRSRH